MILDQKIDSLKNGQSVEISAYNGIVCTAEKSTDGKTIRFVRTYSDGSFTVFHKVRVAL